ncbi:hypothetical protein DKY63_23455 [Pseudomonas putida]|uniref:Uncharacterized protein n=1 Tax=Pseudomonas putida TaxID=303 RepID=A0A2Z4RNQ1_PSEPU|nr:hypothetical protein DKY63_23455 [Pseudomonas putida]
MQLFFVGLMLAAPLKPDFAAPYSWAEVRVRLADDIERRILWLTNRQWIRKTQTPTRRPRLRV